MAELPITPGGSRPGAGRKKDVFKHLFDNAAKKVMTPAAMERLLQTTYDAAINDKDMKAAALLFDRLLGKAPQSITGEDGGALEIRVIREPYNNILALTTSGTDETEAGEEKV